MITYSPNIELNNNGSPLLSWHAQLASHCLLPVLILTSYSMPLCIGFYYSQSLEHSPLVNFMAYIFGFLASFISWIIAFLLGGIVFGKFEFATKVFLLVNNHDFNIAIAMVFLTVPFTGMLSRIINRTINSNNLRSTFTFTLLFFLIVSSICSINYISKLPNSGQYFFSCICIGILFFILFLMRWSKKTPEPELNIMNDPNSYTNNIRPALGGYQGFDDNNDPFHQ